MFESCRAHAPGESGQCSRASRDDSPGDFGLRRHRKPVKQGPTGGDLTNGCRGEACLAR